MPVMLALAIAVLLLSVAGLPARANTHAKASTSVSGSQTELLPKGQVIEAVTCINNSAHSYALYLPSHYKPEKRWPILYAFDPGARGKAPVERFRGAAEKYGWIVVGSNNSSNGPLQPAVDAWNAILSDTRERFTIADGRVYVTGFSGGARLAVQLANLCDDCVAGVIACGAGFPAGVTPSPSMHFLFFGTIGIEDFNFPEVKSLDLALTKAGIIHHVKVYDGRHDWAPDYVATEAVEWLEVQAMKAGKRPRDTTLIESIWVERLYQARKLEASKSLYEAYQAYLGMSENFKGLRDNDEVEKKVSQLREIREVKDAVRDEQQQIKRQRQIESQVYGLIAAAQRKDDQERRSGDIETSRRQEENRDEPFDPRIRLQGTLAELRKQQKGAEDSGERRVARRVLDGLFVGLFEQGSNFLQTRKLYNEAVRTFKLATEVNPDRPGTFFYLAWAHAVNGDKKKSLQALKTAIEKGFSDLAAINDNKAFESIRTDPQYQQIILRLQKIN